MQTITFKLPEPLLEKLEAFAEQEERSKSFLIRKAVEAYLREMEEDEADYQEAVRYLDSPKRGKNISLEEYARKHGLAIPVKPKGK